MTDIFSIFMLLCILVNMALLISIASWILDLRADLYYYSEQKSDDDGLH